MSRFTSSRDGNERELCRLLEAIPGRHITVQPIEGGKAYAGSALPNAGTPDILVGMNGRTWVMEVKNPETRQSSHGSAWITTKALTDEFAGLVVRFGKRLTRKLRRGQALWIRDWAGSPVHVVETAREAAAILGVCLTCGADAVPTTGLCADCQADVAMVS